MRCCRLHKIRFTLAAIAAALASIIFWGGLAQSQPPGGPGGPDAPDQLIVEKYDIDKDGMLDTAERKTAREDLRREPRRQRRGPRRQMVGGKPGPNVAVSEATSYPNAEFYDPTVLRTLFLEFENDDWEQELATFKPTDVEVPAKLTVDGNEYPNVGVSFRGASSFFMIPEGLKRSLNISIDFIDKKQRLYGYKSLNLLNCNGDPSMMSSIIYSYLSGQRIATPKVNYVKVVINGQSWGLYVSSQQFNKTFVEENYSTTKGARWKVHGSPRGDGGLRYLGEEIEPYRKRFEIKSKDRDASWRDLIELCRLLNETPDDQLEEKLTPILDIEGALWFLAVDVATANSDGYWVRASDYNIYQHPGGKFHILPHDTNEAFQVARQRGPGGPPRDRRGNQLTPGDAPTRGTRGDRPPEEGPRRRFGGPPPRDRGPGGFGPPRDGGPGGSRRGRGPRHGGIELDPLVGLDDDRMPLRSVLLNHPKWQRQYLENLKEIATLMQWQNLGERVQQHRDLIAEEVALDTRKLFTTERFSAATADIKPEANSTSFRAFADRRSAFLLNHEKIKALAD